MLILNGGYLNDDIYTAFLEKGQLYQGKERHDLKVGIMPTANLTPVKTASKTKNAFIRNGVCQDNIDIIPIAVKDDPSTEFDESQWKNNGYDKYLAQTILEYDAIWFEGGSQRLIAQSLIDENGEDTPVLSSIRSIYSKGAMIGGTSAGAAIMGVKMIACGENIDAMTLGATTEQVKDNRVLLQQGIGLFEVGIIDQHFNQKGRFGRIIVGALETGNRYAFGIDERTAFIVNDQEKEIEVIGEHGITIFDFKNVQTHKGYPIQLEGIQISYLENGDTFNWGTHTFTLSDNKRHKIVKSSHSQKPADLEPFSPYKLKKLLLNNLVDNESQETAAIVMPDIYLNKNDLEEDLHLHGFYLNFRKSQDTVGFLERRTKQDKYAVLHATLDIIPFKTTTEFMTSSERPSF